MKEKRNTRETLAISLLVISLILITAGTSFAFFNYSRQGTIENKIETGKLTFVYDESRASGSGVNLTNAFPMSDDNGKNLKDADKIFDFDIKATTQGSDINYEIYLTNDGSNLDESVVKTYLVTLSGVENNESEPDIANLPTGTNLNFYNKLYDSKVPSILKQETSAKTLYRETIKNGTASYTKTFRYKMWLDSSATTVSSDGTWQYNNKTFKVKVNVYAQNDSIDAPTAPASA